MYEAVTHRVKVTVEPAFDPERSDPDLPRYFWRYSIEIANLGDQPVTLIERHWRITDAHGRQLEVNGPGVIGEQPTIEPGKSFRYTSGCQGREAPPGIDAFGCLCSLRARSALDGVSWVQGG